MLRFFTQWIGKRGQFAFLFSLLLLIIFISTTGRAEGNINGVDIVAQQNSTAYQVFNWARDAYNNGNWLYAAMYFKSYTIQNPEIYQQDATHRKQVDDALNYSITQINQLKIDLDNCQNQLDQIAGEPGLGKQAKGLTSPPPSIAPIPSAPVSYPLVCRGGSDYNFYYLNSSSVSRNPQIWINYRKGMQKVGQNNEFKDLLDPGDCSWKDRIVAATEPGQIILLSDMFDPTVFNIGWNNGSVVWGGSERYKFLKILDGDKQGFVTFYVYNDRYGHFIVTKVVDY